MKAKTGSDLVFYASVSMLLLSLFMTLAANRSPAAPSDPASPADHGREYARLALTGLLEQVARPATAR